MKKKPLRDGDRVYYQPRCEKTGRLLPGMKTDLGTVVDGGFSVLWDTGEADPLNGRGEGTVAYTQHFQVRRASR